VKTTRVYLKGGRWYYVEDLGERHPRTGRPRQKWHALTRVGEGEAALHHKLAELLGEAPKPRGNMPDLLKDWQAVHFRTLTFDVKKEYERMSKVAEDALRRVRCARGHAGRRPEVPERQFRRQADRAPPL